MWEEVVQSEIDGECYVMGVEGSDSVRDGETGMLMERVRCDGCGRK